MNGFLEWLFGADFMHVTHGHTVTVVTPIRALLFLATWIWTSWDATRRGKSAIVAVLFVMLAWWPVSLLWWLWLRPPVLPSEGGAGFRFRLKPLEWLFLGVLILSLIGVLVFLRWYHHLAQAN